jgi:hypothetical protein
VADLQVAGGGKADASSLDLADLTLVLADLDPSIGADYLLAWTDRVMIALTAGGRAPQMVRTAGDLVRTAGLELRLAALLHTERTDDSSGTAGFDGPVATQLVDDQDRLVVVRNRPLVSKRSRLGRSRKQRLKTRSMTRHQPPMSSYFLMSRLAMRSNRPIRCKQ